ncbi:MAG: hypothetical protein U0793_02175 [Gemmataceae bacterium]
MRILRCSPAICVFALSVLVAAPAPPAWALKELPLPKRDSVTIDPKTPGADLLPPAPDAAPLVPPWRVDDLATAPEIRFQKFAVSAREERARLIRNMTDDQDKDAERMAHGIAKINHLNKEGRDHFLRVLLKSRPDLAGLPFAMDDACRTSKGDAEQFLRAVGKVRGAMVADGSKEGGPEDPAKQAADEARAFWERYENRLKETAGAVPMGPAQSRARIAALMQMLAPDSVAKREGLIRHLAGIKEREAATALTRLAVFSPEAELRDAALAALKARRDEVDAAILLHGLRYPWPAVAKQAAEAIVKLERRDLLPEAANVLDEPDPRAPALRGGKRVVREVVRLNHHHNCLLCHAPANTPDVKLDELGRSRENITVGAVAIPGQPLPAPSFGYNPGASPDTFVRVDVNYLRQDFSLMQPVKNADPWPAMQRFDFLVRTREVSEKEAKDYQAWHDSQGADYRAPNQAAALRALRSLTGRDGVEPTAAAWRKVLER